MRTYLILKEKAEQWRTDAEIQALLDEINTGYGRATNGFGKYTPEKARDLRAELFERQALGARGLPYERLDQLTNELLLGVR
jgi:xylose isomerase